MKKASAKKPLTKKWWFWVIVALLAWGIIGAALGLGDTPAPVATPEPVVNTPDVVQGNIVVSFDVTAGGENGNTVFYIKTNLPDETELMLTLDNGNGYRGQTHCVVANGEAVSDVFSNGGEALSGDYVLTISMSLPKLQSESVRAVIGEKGEFISGPYVEVSEITGENVVSAAFNFSF